MSKIDSDLEEISAFLRCWTPSYPDLSEKSIRAKAKSSYKQFHSLLVWGLVLDSVGITKNAKLYFTECLSDISHAYFLNLCSLYKSSRSSLRGAIENGIRVLLIDKEVEVVSIVSVSDMFARAKAECQADSVALAIVKRLHQLYGELCKSVHSSNTDYLSLTVPFEKLSEFEDQAFSKNSAFLRDVSSALNQCAFWIWEGHLSLVGHANSDLVRDAIPRSLKRAKTAQSELARKT
jgi:hypothetical protein